MALPTNSSNTYEDFYDVFGGQEATNSLLTTLRGLGLDDNAISSTFAPYRPATPATTPATTGGLTQVANNTVNTGALTQADTSNVGGLSTTSNPPITGGLSTTPAVTGNLTDTANTGALKQATTNATGSNLATVTGGAGTDTTSGLSALDNTVVGSTASTLTDTSTGTDDLSFSRGPDSLGGTSRSNITRSGLSGQAGQMVIEGDDIETQIAQLPTEYASWQTSSEPGYIDFIRKDDGAVLDRRKNNTFSDLDLLKIGLSFIPGAGTILAVINTADAVRSGNLLQAAIGVTGLMPGMANVNTALRVGQAVDSGNAMGALTALASNSDLQKYFGTNNLTIGGYTAKDAVSAANLYTASQNGNLAGVIASAGSLINSPNTVLAGRALAVMTAAESGNPNALSMAVAAFNSAVGGGGTSTTTGTTTGTTAVADTVPLTAEEIADLTPEQLRIYQESGVAGLRDFNRSMRNLTSLTTSGLTGDSMGGGDFTTGTSIATGLGDTRSISGTGALSTATSLDDFENSEITRLRGLGWSKEAISAYLENLNFLTESLDTTNTSTTGGLTGTRSLTGTGALSRATTIDEFENSEITRLRGLGYTKEQISAYLDNLSNLTASLDKTDTSGLSDFGLAAFRQAKAAGATDAEALATANIAISGKFPSTVVSETETGTSVELVVTDTNGESNIYSFYDTQSEFETGTELIVTSGRETGQQTQSETLTEVIVTTASETVSETESITEVIVTTASETVSETQSDTLTEIIVTTASETESETLTEIIVTTASETQSETESDTLTEIIVTTASETVSETESETITEVIVTTASETVSETETDTLTEIIVTTASETVSETESETLTEIIVTTSSETVSETESDTLTEIIVTTSSETVSETESDTLTEIIVTTASETISETETDTLTEIIVTTSSETESETDTLTEIIVTTSSETVSETETETETITEIVVTTSSETQSETETETITKIYTELPPTEPPTPPRSFTAGTPAVGGRGKPNEFLKEQLLKTYMTKDSFKDPLAQFNKARQELMKDDMMQQGVDPRLAAILAARSIGEEPPPAPAYNYGEEPDSIDDILGLKVEGDRGYAQGGYVQPLMARGGMALPLLAAKGGLPAMHKGREDFRGGKHVAGEGDGQSDDIPAMLADGEFVFPADVVSALGNGSTKAGTDKLYEMMHSIRDRARSKGRKDLPPPALKSPLDYLKKR